MAPYMNLSICMAALACITGCGVEKHHNYAFNEPTARIEGGQVVARLRGTMKRTSKDSSEMGSPYDLILLFTLGPLESLDTCSVAITEIELTSSADGTSVLSRSSLLQLLRRTDDGNYAADFLVGSSDLEFENHRLKFNYLVTGDCQYTLENSSVSLGFDTKYSEKTVSFWDALMGV